MVESEAVLLLTKLLPIFVYPLGLAICLLLAGALYLVFEERLMSLLLMSTAIIVLWVCSTPAIAKWALASLERQNLATTIANTEKADVAILLGGAIGQPMPPRVTADLSRAADRVLHAARLYRGGKVERILVAAGNFPGLPSVKSEAELIRELLIEWGVPERAIEIASASRNTYENAIEIRAMMDRLDFRSALLVTSAAHMPRALAVFRHVGLPVTPATTDVEVIDEPERSVLAWLPSPDALTMTTAAMKEWIGMWVYRARGYL